MRKKDFIFFDCMETLIDLHKLPNLRDYAAWGYDGSGVEELWQDFDEYFRFYVLAKADMLHKLAEHQDYEMRDRFLHTVNLSLPDMDPARAQDAAERLYKNYWRNYKAQSYVRDDVREVLRMLSVKYRMGVVSNFMVLGGIEEMLEFHGIIDYFECVVTSIAIGWRKPHPAIYGKAFEKTGAAAANCIFVGDDYVNDYLTPAGMGMHPVFLDRYGRHPELTDRVSDFYQLAEILTREGK